MLLLSLRRFVSALVAVLAFVPFLAAQADDPQKPQLGFPQIVFELNWRDADPHWYEVAVDSTGRASYQSEPKVLPDETPGERYFEKFTLTPKTTSHIFELADAAKRFEGDFEYKGKVRMAQTGIKTLKYQANDNTHSTSFNWSENPQIMELTGIFQKLSTTVELGRQLRHAQRFDKLGLDAILKRMEEMQKGNDLIELQVIAPVLQRVVNDNSGMNIARQRATRLLAVANASK